MIPKSEIQKWREILNTRLKYSIIEEVLVREFETISCFSCRYFKSDFGTVNPVHCEDCRSESDNWGLSRESAAKIAEKIVDLIDEILDRYER